MISADHTFCASRRLRAATFDEVQHVIACVIASREASSPTIGVDRNVYRRSLVRPQRTHDFSHVRGGPQGLRRPRFSFFRFSCQTARRPCDPPPRGNRRAAEAQDFRIGFGCLVTTMSEVLRRRAIAPKPTGAPLWGLYSRGVTDLSTLLFAKFSPCISPCATLWKAGFATASVTRPCRAFV